MNVVMTAQPKEIGKNQRPIVQTYGLSDVRSLANASLTTTLKPIGQTFGQSNVRSLVETSLRKSVTKSKHLKASFRVYFCNILALTHSQLIFRPDSSDGRAED